MHVLALSKDLLSAQGLELSKSKDDARTSVKDLKDRHHNALNLTLSKLSKLAGLMASDIRVEDEESRKWALFTKRDVVQIVRSAVSEGRLEKKALSEKMRTAIESSAHDVPS